MLLRPSASRHRLHRKPPARRVVAYMCTKPPSPQCLTHDTNVWTSSNNPISPCRHRPPRTAEAMIAGRARQRGRAENAVSRRPVVAAVRLSTNHGGFGASVHSPCHSDRGAGRNGPVTTVRSVSSSSSALWTTPRPLWMSSSGGRGRPPTSARGEVADTGPRVDGDRPVAQRGEAFAQRLAEARAVGGWMTMFAPSVPCRRSLAASTARSGRAARCRATRPRRARGRSTRCESGLFVIVKVEAGEQGPLGRTPDSSAPRCSSRASGTAARCPDTTPGGRVRRRARCATRRGKRPFVPSRS